MVTTADQTLVVKLGAGAVDEAEGLERLAAVLDGPPVPSVVHVESDLLVTTYIEQGERMPGHEESFGRALAMLHRAPFPHWGGGSHRIGACTVDASPSPDAAGFYGARLGELSLRCGLEDPVARVIDKLGDLLPPGGPSLLHGDLWWGNLLFGADGRTWLIDPSVHGGHPEEDLAMLALFGTLPDRILGAYTECLALREGWRERIELFQLYPLLVHAVLFGGSYLQRAEQVARHFG
jgi:fructosamine-3-kinase